VSVEACGLVPFTGSIPRILEGEERDLMVLSAKMDGSAELEASARFRFGEEEPDGRQRGLRRR
jgi:hypothetical protein